MTLTRSQLAARAAGCRVTIDQPVVSQDGPERVHTWEGCGCTYQFIRAADGLPELAAAEHCTDWGTQS